MPRPPRQTPYALRNKALLKAAKAVAVETVTSAAEEIHSLKPAFQDGLVKCGVSCDGNWQRRGPNPETLQLGIYDAVAYFNISC